MCHLHSFINGLEALGNVHHTVELLYLRYVVVAPTDHQTELAQFFGVIIRGFNSCDSLCFRKLNLLSFASRSLVDQVNDSARVIRVGVAATLGFFDRLNRERKHIQSRVLAFDPIRIIQRLIKPRL